MTGITVDFSGPVNAAEADNTAFYQLKMEGSRGSFTAKNAKVIKLASASYNGALDQVVLKPRKTFALTKPVQLLINGQPPGGLQDTTGQFIDGAGHGTGGNNGEFVLSKKGAARENIAVSPSPGSQTIRVVTAAVPSNPPVLIGITTPPEDPGFKPKK